MPNQTLTATQPSSVVMDKLRTYSKVLSIASVSIVALVNAIGKYLSTSSPTSSRFIRAIPVKLTIISAATTSIVRTITSHLIVNSLTVASFIRFFTVSVFRPVIQRSIATVVKVLNKELEVITVSYSFFSRLFIKILDNAEQLSSVTITRLIGKPIITQSIVFANLTKVLTYLRTLIIESPVIIFTYRQYTKIFSVASASLSSFVSLLGITLATSSGGTATLLKNSYVVLVAVSVTLSNFIRFIALTIRTSVGSTVVKILNIPVVISVSSVTICVFITTFINRILNLSLVMSASSVVYAVFNKDINRTIFIVVAGSSSFVVKSVIKSLNCISTAVIKDFRGTENNAVLILHRTLLVVSSGVSILVKNLFKTLVSTPMGNCIASIFRKWG